MRPRVNNKPRGMSLVEMLVVIGVILLILSFLTPMVAKMARSAAGKAGQLDLQAIAAALDAYKSDMRAYPRGGDATVLARSLVDGFKLAADGKGRTYGPYLSAEKFRVDRTNNRILDRWSKPINYYPRNLRNVKVGDTTQGVFNNTGDSLYDFRHGDYQEATWSAGATALMRVILGDENYDNAITGSEVLRFDGPYILVSCGPDGKAGPASSVAQAKKCDDVFNFER